MVFLRSVRGQVRRSFSWRGLWRTGRRRLLLAVMLVLLLAGLALARAAFRRGVPIAHEGPMRAGHGMGSPATNLRPASSESGRPHVEAPVMYYDFGSIGAQEVVRREFLVINHGSGALLIRGAYTTCGCTTADLSASRIPPGQAAQVTVTFDAGFHRVSGQTVRRGLILETNDPDHPQVEIWVQAEVR